MPSHGFSSPAFAPPDFACIGPPALDRKDLLFLFEHFPTPGVDAVAAAQAVIEHPSTMDSLLESRFVADAMMDPAVPWLDVSPRLWFNVQLRRALPGRREGGERRTIHYLANLLALFASTERLHRVQSGESESYDYLVDLMRVAAEATGERRFLVLSHIGNYALFLAGLCAPWIEHRHRYYKRPLSLDYYCNMSKTHFASASKHALSETLGLKAVFVQLASRFDYYRGGLQTMTAAQPMH